MTDKTKISQPFADIRYNENTGTQKVIEWMKKVNADKDLGFGDIVFDTSSAVDRRRPDALIYEQPKSKKILCLIEFKKPEEEHTRLDVIDKAQREARYRASPYFATSNFKELVWFDTKDKHQIDWFTLSSMETLEMIEDIRYKSQITQGLEKFLINLYEIHTGKVPKTKRNLDEVLRYILHQKVDFLANNYTPIIRDRVHKDKTFARDLRKWFAEQSWERSDDPEQDYRKTAYQAAYLLINKIIFYDALQAKNSTQFDKLEIPDSFTKGGLLAGHLQNYFNAVLKIDYETIYTTDFIDQIAFPEHRDVVDTIKDLVNFLDRYDFAKIGVDIIGRIFEGLIPVKERHNLGQFFTNPDIVDIILRFCMKHENDKVFDPSCGTGTFLVRAYQHKKLMNRRLGHEEILKTLWGTDIAKFPAHLATINLAINDLGVEENYPYILREDFFTLTLGGYKYKQYEKSRMREVKGLGKTKIQIPYPATVDCIVGNPPYTRQEEIPTTGVNKAQLIDNALLDINNVPLATLSKRAGIHAYFFVHGFKFLNNGGRFGFIVSNSWLDVDYGKGLQEFFLRHAKIVAIIESKVERWFSDADINTCIVILEKASGEKLSKERDNNLVRFVQLKKKLTELNIQPISDIWDKQKARLDAIDGLIKTILGHNEYYENDEMRIFPKSQKELWVEGFDKETNTYIGAKWGKYIRAPQIFFKILKKSKDKLVPLKEVADVRRGFTTGANEFFYLTEAEIKHWKIEKEFWMHKEDNKWVPNYVVKSPDEITTCIIDAATLNSRVLMVHKDRKTLAKTNILQYINRGERKKYNKRPTLLSRGDNWYDLGTEIRDIIAFPERMRKRFAVYYNHDRVFLNKNLYGIEPINKKLTKPIIFALNSTISFLWTELLARQPGGGGGPLDIDVYVVQSIPFYKDKLLEEIKDKLVNIGILQRKIGSIFEELGADSPETVSFDQVKPDRRELDKIIMGDILGLTEAEQLEVYKAVVDLVKSRLDKAKSFGKKGKTKDGVDLQRAMEELEAETGKKE